MPQCDTVTVCPPEKNSSSALLNTSEASSRERRHSPAGFRVAPSPIEHALVGTNRYNPACMELLAPHPHGIET
jgi:hypothetical protein